MIKLTIEGKPHPHTPHRCGCRGRKPFAYPASTNEPWRTAVRRQARRHRPKHPLEGPLEVVSVYRFPRPKAHLRSNGEVREGAPSRPITRASGDADNLCKDSHDVLTELQFWVDDSQIVDLIVHKEYADEENPPGWEVSIRRLED